MRRLIHRVTSWALKKNLVLTVLVFLIASWLGVSWLVYRVESGVKDANILSFSDSIWWGIVTFLTVGYGDRYPVTTEGRLLAGWLMIAGVVAVGIATAKISSYFMEQALREGRGTVETSQLKDHFVICGWKDQMGQLLTHILEFNAGLTADQIVLVANFSQGLVDELRAIPRLKDINIVVGDYFSETNLKRAAPERARKIMILADRTPGPNGQVPTPTEVDAKTIMTAMTLAHIARGTVVAAEILEPKMDKYLKLAAVSEVIYSREYNRLMLVNASGGTGVANIIFELLDPSTPAFLTTEHIPDMLVSRTYGELRARFAAARPELVLLGVLENSGSRVGIKEQALRNAQKTADVHKLLENLRHVKELRCNRPVFHPADSYVINEGSMAIVVLNRRLIHAVDSASAAAA